MNKSYFKKTFIEWICISIMLIGGFLSSPNMVMFGFSFLIFSVIFLNKRLTCITCKGKKFQTFPTWGSNEVCKIECDTCGGDGVI